MEEEDMDGAKVEEAVPEDMQGNDMEEGGMEGIAASADDLDGGME